MKPSLLVNTWARGGVVVGKGHHRPGPWAQTPEMSDHQAGHLATTRGPSLDSFKLCLPMPSSKRPPLLDTVTLE